MLEPHDLRRGSKSFYAPAKEFLNWIVSNSRELRFQKSSTGYAKIIADISISLFLCYKSRKQYYQMACES
jgi:hypothetical protein